jgi:MYXO-CTERM domain-containing protein
MFLLPLPPAHASDVVVFGDSWAEGSADELEDVLAAHGHRDLTVDPRGVGGTTAEYWAISAPTALPDAVSANSDARWVWLSIGGNDLFAHFYAGTGGQNAADYDLHLRAMLDGLYAEHPDIQVVAFGYDFVNFEQSQECILTAWAYFGTSITTGQVNQYFLDDVGGTLESVEADYPNFTYVDSVWGTLQAAGGVPGAPNVLLPSPSEYMSDCIHPTSEGYSLVHDALYDGYWGQPEPTVALDGATDVCVGDTVALSASGSNIARYAWYVDGVYSSSDGTLSLTPAAGTSTIEVRAMSGAWSATDSATLTTWPVPAPAISGTTDVAPGAAATFQVSLGAEETATWSAPGGTVIDAEGDTLVVRWDGRGDYVVSVDVTTPGGCAGSAEVAVTVSGDADDTGPVDTDEADDTDDPAPAADGDGCGCSTEGGPAPLGALAALALLMRRRRYLWARC